MRWILPALIAAAAMSAVAVLYWSLRARHRRSERARASTPPGPRARTALIGGLRATPQPEQPDPFEVLRVQMRLGALADEVRALERNGNLYARGHHLKATQAAYDALLLEACLLAGIDTVANPRPTIPQDEIERFREEVELVSRGWTW